MLDTERLIGFGLGALAGVGWMFALGTVLTIRRLRSQLRFAVRVNHDLTLALHAERAMRIEAVAQMVADPLAACASKCADAILKHKGVN